MSFLPSMPANFVSVDSPTWTTHHPKTSNLQPHNPSPPTALYYSNFWRYLITPIALVAFPLVLLVTIICSVCYCIFKKKTFQELVAKLGLLALSANTKKLDEIRTKHIDNQISTTTSDGIELNGIKIDNGKEKWIVALNGTTGTWEHNIDGLNRMSDHLNANVICFNYRGVGASKGYCKSSDELILDGIAMVKHLLDKGIKEEDIIIYGHSLGGGVGAQLMLHYKKIKFISDRSFASFKEAAVAFFWIPVYRGIIANTLNIWWKLDSYEAIKNQKDRTLIIVTHQDYIINFHASLYYAFTKRKETPPITISMEYPIAKNLSCLSRCNELGRTHVWETTKEIFQHSITLLTTK